jgi:hypothetical protein
MAKLIYASNMSIDGWTEDEYGALDWAPPDDDVFVFITEVMRSIASGRSGRLTDSAEAEVTGSVASAATERGAT